MQTKLRAATLAIVVLLVGMMAGPAFAQQGPEEIPEGFENRGQCEAAVRQIRRGVEDVNVSETLRERIEDLLASGEIRFICTVYIPTDIEPPEVLPEPPVERPEVPEPEEPEEERPTPVPPGRPVPPAEVLGESLSRTGADALTLGAIGLGLVGLGVLAVRRSRPVSAS